MEESTEQGELPKTQVAVMGTLKSCGTRWASHRGLGSKNGQQWMFLSFVFLCEPLRVSLLRKTVWCSSSELEPWSKTT